MLALYGVVNVAYAGFMLPRDPTQGIDLRMVRNEIPED